MKITGREAIPVPVETVWDALLDPAVLVRTIPGCERLETLPSPEGEHTYAMTVTAGVAAIRGTYDGTCTLSDLVPHESLVMRLTGAGAPGTIDATVHVSFRDADPTLVEYDADAVGSVAAPGVTTPARPAATGEAGQVFTAPARPASAQQDFLKGIAVGAGLVLLGVLAGGLFGRRRR